MNEDQFRGKCSLTEDIGSSLNNVLISSVDSIFRYKKKKKHICHICASWSIAFRAGIDLADVRLSRTVNGLLL